MQDARSGLLHSRRVFRKGRIIQSGELREDILAEKANISIYCYDVVGRHCTASTECIIISVFAALH